MQNLFSNMPETFHRLREGLIFSVNPSQNHFDMQNYSYALDGVVLKINLVGTSTYESQVCDFRAKLQNNTTLLSMVNSDIAKEEHQINENNKTVSVIIRKDFLEQILPENAKTAKIFDFFQSKDNIKTLDKKPINPKTKIVAQNILSNSYINELKYLFLESAVLEILYAEFSDFFTNKSNSSGTIFTQSDKEAIYHAKNILENNTQKPPTISELSRKVAINEFKLKAGFKKFINQTPCQFSISNRMQKAKELLKIDDLSINEIAQKVGYSSPSSFSNTFYKTYKIRPMELMKKRKYYY